MEETEKQIKANGDQGQGERLVNAKLRQNSFSNSVQSGVISEKEAVIVYLRSVRADHSMK